MLDAGAEQDADVPNAIPAPMLAEAVIDEDAMVASAAEHPAMITDLPRAHVVIPAPCSCPACGGDGCPSSANT